MNCEGDLDTKKKQNLFCLSGKVKATIFWDRHGVIFIDYITGAYHTIITEHAEGRNCRKRLRLQKKVFASSETAMVKIHEILLDHPPYSSNLAKVKEQYV